VTSFITKMGKKTVNQYYNEQRIIGGSGVIVEIDESKFGKVKYIRGHRVEEIWVFGLVERTPERRIVLAPVNDRTRGTLEEILKKHVHPDSIIHSDSFRSYAKLKNIFAGHKKVNHSQYFVDPSTWIHTNTIKGNWHGVKDQISVRHGSKNFIELYLIRYSLRRNHKDIFQEIIKLLLKLLFVVLFLFYLIIFIFLFL
ncbi:hypothetical protein H312_00382, partial [Anncaliia algerae PRA339]